jgi:hypothetical protein
MALYEIISVYLPSYAWGRAPVLKLHEIRVSSKRLKLTCFAWGIESSLGLRRKIVRWNNTKAG